MLRRALISALLFAALVFGQNKSWTEPFPAHKVIGNVYYVGSKGLASYLITTPEGHILAPPTGHMAGIYARVDIERGVHKAPANEVVRGIVTRDLSAENKPLRFILNKQQHDLLNPKGVNVIRDFRPEALSERRIVTGEHCYGCTAGGGPGDRRRQRDRRPALPLRRRAQDLRGQRIRLLRRRI